MNSLYWIKWLGSFSSEHSVYIVAQDAITAIIKFHQRHPGKEPIQVMALKEGVIT